MPLEDSDIAKSLSLLKEFRESTKSAFQPSGAPQPPMAPPGGAQPPVDPAMAQQQAAAGGMPPGVDPAMMGGAPMPQGQGAPPPVQGMDPNLIPQLVTGFEQVVNELQGMRERQEALTQELNTTKEELIRSNERVNSLESAMKSPSAFEGGPGAAMAAPGQAVAPAAPAQPVV